MCFPQDPRWFPLLSSKYTKQKPALLLSFQLESDTKPSEPSPDRFKAKRAPPRQGQHLSMSPVQPGVSSLITFFSFSVLVLFCPASPALELLSDKLEPVLVPDKGYHQIGPADMCSDMFVLSVTVAFATKLEQVTGKLHQTY